MIGYFNSRHKLDVTLGLAPLPELFPYLDEGLHLFRAREPVVNQAALLVAACVKIPQRLGAQVRDVVAKVFEVLLAQDVRFFAIGTPGHDQG